MSTETRELVTRARSLLDHGQSELAELYTSLPAVSPEEARGEWSGDMAAVAGLEHLPRTVRKAVHSAMCGPVGPWQGKRFDGARGSNVWGTRGPRRDWLGFNVENVEHGPVDGQPSLWLDYDVPRNPRLFRAVRGELRRLDAELVLGRMSWQTRSGLFCVMYFPMRAKV